MSGENLRRQEVMRLHPSRTHRPASDSKKGLVVAIVAESFLPLVNGVTNSVLRTAEHMTDRGHEVHIIAPGPGDPTYRGVRVHRVSAIRLPFYRTLSVGYSTREMRRLLRQIKPDVVHLASPAIMGLAATKVCEEIGVPSVAVYQTDLAGFAQKYGLGLASRGLWRFLSSIHNRASVTLAPSTSAVWDLRHHGVQNVRRWMRGVNLVQFDPAKRDESLKKTLAPNGEILVGYVGRLAREKGVERLAPLCNVPGVKILIVGEGPDRRRLVRKLPGATFVGFKSGEDLAKHYATLDLFVHTGTDETFCQAIQEALASGVPVVAPAMGGPIDIVTHGVNGYLWTPGVDSTLVGAVEELVRNRIKREKLATNARPSVSERTWFALMDELEGHYRALTQGLAFAYSGISA